MPVGGLAIPAAVELFADRARAVQPGFLADGPVGDVIEDICRRLDGLPLAVELAAARLRALPLAIVAERLDDRFRLLTGGARTALPRQQTLRAVVDFSERIPATFVYASIHVKRNGLLSGTRGEQIAGRVGMVRTSAFPRGEYWTGLISALEDSLCCTDTSPVPWPGSRSTCTAAPAA